MKKSEKKEEQSRTEQQNRALHLYFTFLSDELNGAGLDMRKMLKPEIEIPWTPFSVKEYLWRPIQKSMLGFESTTKLKKRDDINNIYETLNRHLSEKFGLHVDFPSMERFFESGEFEKGLK